MNTHGKMSNYVADAGIDYPGSGVTPRSEFPLSLDQLADELVWAAVEEGLETFAIVGFSVGGPVAVRAATRHPDRVSALVLSAAYSHLDQYMNFSLGITAGVQALGDPLLLAKLLTLMSLSPQTLNDLPEDVLQAAAAASAEAQAPGAPEQFDLFARVDIRAELTNIKAPTLVIATTENRIVPLAHQQDLAARIPGARLSVVHSGHLLPLENPTEWQTLITTFLDDDAARQGSAAAISGRV